MKYLKLFGQGEDAIYNESSDTVYDAPGVSYIIGVDKVVYAPFDLNQKYYIDENYDAVLYRESYIDITSSSENIILSDSHKEKSYVVKFEYKKILPETISIVIQQTGNMTYSYSDITIDEETHTGEFILTVSSEEYGIDTLYINLIGTGENEQEFISNIVRYTISYEDTNKPLTLSILEDGQVKFGNLDLGLSNMYYKINDGQWTKYIETLPINVRKGDKLQFKGNNTSLSQVYGYKQFSSTCKFNVSGHLGSLLSEDYETLDLSNVNPTGSYAGCFSHMFANCKVVDASQLIMPKLMTEYCYSGMMAGCFDLEYVPELQEFTTLYSGSYAGMFKDCQNLKYAPTKIIAINTDYSSCKEMFRNCTKIQNTPKIQIENVGSGALAGTFENCVSLVSVDDIEFTTVGDEGCYNMFRNCVGLRDISKFNLSSLIEGNQSSFKHTFENCASLYNLMESIELETVWTGCFCGTFAGCFSIEETPIMKYTSVACGACCGMFEDCTNLKSVPLLDVGDLNGDACFEIMFRNCENLNYIKTTLPDWGGDNSGNQKYTYDWVNNVAEEGTFVKTDFLPTITGVSNIPTNWLVEEMEDPNLDKYLAFTILEDGDITISNKTNGQGKRLDLQYKLNDNDWENIQLSETKSEDNYPYYTYYTQTLNLNQGDIIKFRGDNILTDGGYYDDNDEYLNRNNIYFSGSAKFNVSGKISSLLSKRCNSNNVKRRSFEYLFRDCHVVDASELILTSEVREDTYSGMMAGCFDLVYGPQVLPAKNLYTECYRGMFENCTSLETVPEIKAQSTAGHCCYEMFYGCTSLTQAPELKVTNLSDYCFGYMFKNCTNLVQIPELPIASMSTGSFSGMFENCTSLEIAPELPATTLSSSCYSSMFRGCTSLEIAPELPATTLSSSCYYSMFAGCTSLTTAPEIKAQSTAEHCCYEMFYGCTSLEKAYNLLATALTNYCYYSMFYGCTSLETAPEIKGETLSYYCCEYMFTGCTSLIQAPSILPAETLYNSCYYCMFSGCTSLTQAPELPATTLANSCYSYMFSDCTSLIQAPSLPAETLYNSCYSSMFSGCTSLTQAPELPATILAKSCYYSMFSGCTSLTKAPELLATTLVNYCYYYMFDGCSSLNYIKVGFTSWVNNNFNAVFTNYWVRNVAAEGVFECPEELTLSTGDSYIPVGWVVPSKASITILDKETLETPISVEPNTTHQFTINVDLQQLTLEKCNVTSSNSTFTIGTKENNSIVVNFESTTGGTFTSTITVSDNTYNTGKSDSVVLTVNVPEYTNVKAATYNIRYWNGEGDTDNTDFRAWPYRKAKVFEMIRKHDMDVCGLQEVTPQMQPDIDNTLTEYEYIGYGRDSGLQNSGWNTDEQTGLIYKKSKFNKLDQGKFFLSSTPDDVSKVSGSMFNRLATWVKLQDKETLKEFIFASTHFDHPTDSSVADSVREQQAQYAVSNILSIAGNLPIFFVGDFNSESNTTAYSVLTSAFNDSYNFLTEPEGGYVCNLDQINSGKCPGCSEIGNTYTGLYSSSDIDPKRIDFVLYLSDKSSQLSYLADTDNLGLEYYPSDHLPVVCDMVI
jgi:endonuclease/exonuclease/phosphatase family metal-dependent hydrolase